MIQKIGAFCKGKITFIEHEKRGFERIVMENGTLITQDGVKLKPGLVWYSVKIIFYRLRESWILSTISAEEIFIFIPFTSNGDFLAVYDFIINAEPSFFFIITSPSVFTLFNTLAKF